MAKEKKNNKIDETKQYKTEGKKGKKVKNKKKNTKLRKIIKITLLVILLAILIAAGVMFGMIYGIVKEAKLNASDLVLRYENSVVLDSDGNTIAILSGDENREPIKLSEMSPYLRKAFVDIEDERFYEHSGVDVKRTLAATVKYALSKIGIGSADYGGSTITQQTVKNITEEDDRTWQRKVKEIARAYYIEKELSKDQILELYLNVIFMGGNTNIYGVEVASKYYFSKSAKDLDLAESAFLAGINNTPNSYNPFVEDNEAVLERIRKRTTTVLNKMKELGSITDEEYEEAIAEVQEGLKFNKGTIVETIYSYHTDAAIQQIIKQIMAEKDLNYDAAKLYLYGGGYTIYTTQDTSLQNAMNEEAQNSKYMSTKDGEQSQAGMVLLDHKTGHVLAVMGGLGEKTTSLGFNRGTQLVKQTGSAMKPLAVVAPGIESGVITAATVYDDVPYKTYKNYDNKFKGLLTIRYAIEDSRNIPMLKAIQTVGTEKSLEFCKSLGFSKLDDEKDNNISFALGGLTNGASPLEMAAAYGAIANDGVYIEPTFYTKVVDGEGNIVLEPHQETRTVMSSSAAYVVKEILTQPVKSGTAMACSISGMSVAAKTGTTNGDYDRWLCGFTPYYTAATWYGYDNNRTVSGWSLSPATQIWSSIMKQAHTGLTGKTFAETRPSNVVTATVCRDSGLLATDACKNDPRGDRTYTEYFVKGTVPTKKCTTHVAVEICKESGLLANEFCEDTEEQVFITRNNPADTSWKSATDAKYMLTITKECDIHTEAPDKTKPVIKLKGSATITINVGDKFEDPGATASDDKDGDLTDEIKVTGKVNTNKVGTYTITYTVKDKAGNEASVDREVKVVKKADTNNNAVDNNTTSNNTTTNNTTSNNTGNAGENGTWGNSTTGNNTVENSVTSNSTTNNNTVSNTVNNNTVNNTDTND